MEKPLDAFLLFASTGFLLACLLRCLYNKPVDFGSIHNYKCMFPSSHRVVITVDLFVLKMLKYLCRDWVDTLNFRAEIQAIG